MEHLNPEKMRIMLKTYAGRVAAGAVISAATPTCAPVGSNTGPSSERWSGMLIPASGGATAPRQTAARDPPMRHR
jgi:hypothetical protein